MEPRERLILPLDVDNTDSALRLVEMLTSYVGAFKVGLELVNSAGPTVFKQVHDAGAARIFYDAKLHDIPTTVAGAARAAARHGLWLVNVHAAGGSRMLCAAATALRESGSNPPLMIGVTLLTSISPEELDEELSQTARFKDPPPLGQESKGVLDILMLQLSKINWTVALPLLLLALILLVAVFSYRIYRHSKTDDPLKGLSPGLYQGLPPGETLPVPVDTNR